MPSISMRSPRACGPKLVQLWYQMALNGRRDLALAPSPRAGFEMTVLRMLAFRPGEAAGTGSREPGTGTGKGDNVRGPAAAREALATPSRSAAAPTPPPPPPAAFTPAAPEPPRPEPPAASGASTLTPDTWADAVARCALSGPAKELANHAGFLAYEDGILRLAAGTHALGEQQQLRIGIAVRRGARQARQQAFGQGCVRVEVQPHVRVAHAAAVVRPAMVRRVQQLVGHRRIARHADALAVGIGQQHQRQRVFLFGQRQHRVDEAVAAIGRRLGLAAEAQPGVRRLHAAGSHAHPQVVDRGTRRLAFPRVAPGQLIDRGRVVRARIRADLRLGHFVAMERVLLGGIAGDALRHVDPVEAQHALDLVVRIPHGDGDRVRPGRLGPVEPFVLRFHPQRLDQRIRILLAQHADRGGVGGVRRIAQGQAREPGEHEHFVLGRRFVARRLRAQHGRAVEGQRHRRLAQGCLQRRGVLVAGLRVDGGVGVAEFRQDVVGVPGGVEVAVREEVRPRTLGIDGGIGSGRYGLGGCGL